MEQLLDYRHIVERKTKKIFVECVKKALKKTNLKNIGFIGIGGSLDKKLSHDIDVLIFPREDAKIGATIIEVVKLYRRIENILKTYHERFYLALAPKKTMQEMIYYLATLEEGGAGLIPIHSLFFPDYKSFKKFNPSDFAKYIENNIVTLYGNFGVIKSARSEKIPFSKLEPYFVILDFEMNTKTKTFPRHLIRTSTESLLSYLKNKYSIPIKKIKLHNILETEKELKRILKFLDKVTYN